MTEELDQDQVQEQDETQFLKAELKDLQTQLKVSQAENQQGKIAIARLTEELATVSTGDVEQIRQSYQAQLLATQHESGLAAFRAALVDQPDGNIEIAELVALKGGKRFQNVEGKGILLVDAGDVPEFGTNAKPIDPVTAAKTALAKLGTSSKPKDTGLRAWSCDSQGRIIVPKSQSLDQRSVRANLPIADFDSGNWVIVDDAKLNGTQPGTVTRQLTTAQNSRVLEIKTSELQATRDWCRRNSVDPQQFDDLIQADKIKVVA